MSLSGGSGYANAKLGEENLHYGNEPEGPGATRENPAGVYPDVGSTPSAAGQEPGSGAQETGNASNVFGNPMLFNETFANLSGAFTTAINAIKDESGSGVGDVGKKLIAKLEDWRSEVDALRAGKPVEGAEQGEGSGAKVERTGGEGGMFQD